MIAMLDPSQRALDEDRLLVEAESKYGVFLTVAYGVYDVLGEASVWCGKSLAFVLEEFPRRMLERLEEIEASETGRQTWSDLFERYPKL
jgi:hypothetical protein